MQLSGSVLGARERGVTCDCVLAMPWSGRQTRDPPSMTRAGLKQLGQQIAPILPYQLAQIEFLGSVQSKRCFFALP